MELTPLQGMLSTPPANAGLARTGPYHRTNLEILPFGSKSDVLKYLLSKLQKFHSRPVKLSFLSSIDDSEAKAGFGIRTPRKQSGLIIYFKRWSRQKIYDGTAGTLCHFPWTLLFFTCLLTLIITCVPSQVPCAFTCVLSLRILHLLPLPIHIFRISYLPVFYDFQLIRKSVPILKGTSFFQIGNSLSHLGRPPYKRAKAGS